MNGSGGPVLVTGGAGYIGSHVVRQLVAQGYRVVVYDNLSTGHAWAVLGADLVVGDLGDRERLEAVLAGTRFEAVLHFAASIWVGESMREPAKYFRNNVANALGLFELAARHGVPRIVFSSTAAVYGEPGVAVIEENLPLAPVNPYGASKMMAERILQDLASAAGMSYVILRYFNVAGADLEGRIGEATPDNSHLVKVAWSCTEHFTLKKPGGNPETVTFTNIPRETSMLSTVRGTSPGMYSGQGCAAAMLGAASASNSTAV
jgi:UDP-glucose 4-epimerase